MQVHLVDGVAQEEFSCLHHGLEAEVSGDLFAVAARWAGVFKHVFELNDVLEEVHEARVVLVLEGPLDLGVVLPQEHNAFLLTALIVVLFDVVELLLHLLLQLFQEFILAFTDGSLLEGCHRRAFGQEILVFEFFFVQGSLVLNLLLERLVEQVHGVVECLEAFILANIRPGALNAGDRALVDGVDVALAEVPEHVTIQGFAVDHLGLDSLQDLAPEHVYLFDKFRPQCFHRNIDQVLESILIGQWSDHSYAIAIREEAFQKAANPILLIN